MTIEEQLTAFAQRLINQKHPIIACELQDELNAILKPEAKEFEDKRIPFVECKE